MGILSVVLAYLIGTVPFGLIVVKVTTGKDVRTSGSGNIGATNVLRTTGRVAGVLTLFLDIGKAFFAVWLADWLSGGNVLWMSFAALAVLLGHAFPVWLNFQGGKAVASFVGAFAYLTPVPLLAVIVIFVGLVAWTRYLSLGSIVAAGLFPVACWMILHPEWPVHLASVAAAALIIWRHKSNIERIRAGNENVFRFRRTIS
ncbi:MAG: glycerol-3-phosphate 1-O-acyltransferase PlsY [Acidobacteriota bacterium]|nr:glycerol-3-phosphate 1-O-acyltransferase PlsY [Acidobacteriota bacterium]